MSTKVMITGASGGIGMAIAEQLSNDGFVPILVGRSAARLETAVRILGPRYDGKHAKSIVCDVADPASVVNMFEGLSNDGTVISVLVNGAGISGGGITAQITDELWQSIINTNLNGTFYVTREALRLGMISNSGRVINIASTGGKQGVLHGAPYAASKHGMVGFTKSLGLELARSGTGITVNAVCPGFVETEMAERVRSHYAKLWGTDAAETRRRVEDRVPLGRYIEPKEVAAMVSYLASPSAAGITAQALNICGGLGNY